ncbi:cofactor-independent phosphoglycerate mutase [Phocaeicola sp.]|uniref:cofactor-independent phosphoglycerate mutase n=1 Tax=Phocaeicola sp. TaxID=2773926 RepID=UPI0023C23A70|nr:cofactor-independent phosphoglycerate mutase [Phocaeicola sp.]MDE5678423.1 cofactor-independent phosphoglycerate mutase [Phocaeicola sp.]
MKHIIILGDGMADWPAGALGNKTLLQYSATPYMDRLARMGRTGRLITVASGFHPGSEVANMSVMGYDLPKVYEGRGPLEAASIGVELQPGDMAMRCNIICTEDGKIKNHSAGHITTSEADVLIRYLDERLGSDRIRFYTGVQYRHLLVIRGGDKRLDCTPPHDVPLQPFRPLMVKAEVPEAQETADLINSLIMESQTLLAEHPINKRRVAEGKDPANSIWPWSPGYRPQMELLSAKYPSVRKGAVISAVDLINGIGYYAGLRRIAVEGATGLYNTNYENKVDAALDALRTDDFVYLHIEASDEAGHEGDFKLKQLTIEDLDKRVVGPIYEEVKTWNEPVAIAVLPDHPTPCELRTHTAEPVPFLIYYPGIEPDGVQTFDEVACVEGGYGILKEDEFMNEFMKE